MADGRVAGLLLAAGGGRRFGMPKALVTSDGEAWVTRSSRVLAEAGCDPLVVVLGAAAAQALPLVPKHADVVVNSDWATGMGSSLRSGLRRCATLPVDVQALVVFLVDLPGLDADTVAHFVHQTSGPWVDALQQATFQGVIGHPVLLGRSHWSLIADAVGGDTGARSYLAEHDAALVELGHLADGADRDAPSDAGRGSQVVGEE